MLTHPNAKINIGLYVVEKRSDGYHNLQTVFYPIPLQDVLEVNTLRKSNEAYLFQQVGNPIEGNPADNLIIKVYEDLKKDFDLPPLDIYLYKNIPTGAGLGGGSSDAASMIKVLNESYDLGLSPQEMERRVARLGADCAFFIRQRPAYATGIGDILSPISLSLKGWFLALIKPDIAVSTKEAYSKVTPRIPSADLRESLRQPVEAWRDCVSNDFEDSVFLHHPQIAAIKQTLYDMGAAYASMSGSGSSVYGLFKSPKEEEIKEVFKDCFVFHGRLTV